MLIKSATKILFLTFVVMAVLVLTSCSGLPKTSGSGSGSGGPYTVGVTVSGLTGSGLVLEDNAHG